MNKPASSPENHLGLTLAAWVLTLGGWLGLAWLVMSAIPDTGPRWLFFVLWLMALTGTAIPFVRYLNRRFGGAGDDPVPSGVLLRQSLWVGFYGATCAWLQIGRTLNVATALLLAAGLGGVEWFLRMRERSRWVPESSDEPA